LWIYIALATRSALSILAVRKESKADQRADQPAVAAVPILRGARRRANASG
jgi:hypothetical protein